MSRWHEDHETDEQTSRTPSPADEIAERLRRHMRAAKEVELDWQLTKEAQGRRKGKG